MGQQAHGSVESVSSARVLVTGGAGFIGSHLCEALVASGADVTALDDLSCGRRSNLDGLTGHERFRFLKGSVLDESLVHRLAAESEAVYHLAAVVGVPRVLRDPAGTMETNWVGGRNVVDAAVSAKARLVLVSTSEVYGREAASPQHEGLPIPEFSGEEARDSYPRSKRLSELYCLEQSSGTWPAPVIVRLFNIAGPRQLDTIGMVMPSLVKQALSGEDVTVYGTGEQTRTFCDVGEAADAMVRLGALKNGEPLIVNVGSRLPVSINELAEAAVKGAGTAARIRRIGYREAHATDYVDFMRRQPSIDLVRELTGWEPATDLPTIVRRVADSLRES
ncbi:NAD-dependent epimerase/dehydratase family protein [Phytomonospora endophytica]|uniref:UDP-glucose 4-epimerase n=1 Tax=Phytomonospora endophytica TaxID=714109 RepID=A0A841FM81_9ACTN|nr:NAD-dependent epimerase/dehydratase family protein [Phytomonospora endophytica]MBB6034307.1 UDP-glucose 4-epimerase [Phytomonospora endophytica]GIG66701.1 NAD-dependent dehydratase [Phytomonospora endophytica]